MLALLFPYGGSHPDGELLHIHAGFAGRQKMAEFMDEDENAEHKNCDDNTDYRADINPSYVSVR